MQQDFTLSGLKSEPRQKINQNIVVVTCVKSDSAGPARLSHRFQDVQRLVAVERGDFDCADIRDFHEPGPEFLGQDHAADRTLQIETHDRDNFGDLFRVLDQVVERFVTQGGQREQTQVIAQIGRELCLAHSLGGIAHDSCDQNRQLDPMPGDRLQCSRDRQFEHRLIQAHLRLVNRKLCRVYADSQPPCSRRQVVASEGLLTPLIQLFRRS